MKDQIEYYQEKIKRLSIIGQNLQSGLHSGFAHNAISIEINIYRGFIDTLKDIEKRTPKTKNSDSELLDQFEKITQRRDDVLMSYDHEDGYFVSIVDRGMNGQVADNDISAKHFSIRDAIQAAIDYKPKPIRRF